MNEQQTPEYWQSKIGRVGASKITDVMSKGKGTEPSKTRAKYLSNIVAERLAGKNVKTYQSGAMSDGIELEPVACDCYEFKTGNALETCGFIQHPSIEMAGASPDRLLGSDGVLEIKCPELQTHMKYILAKKLPAEYVKQVQWQLACTGRKFAEFVSYCPAFGIDLQLFIIRVERDEELITEMETAVVAFLADVESTIKQLMATT